MAAAWVSLFVASVIGQCRHSSGPRPDAAARTRPGCQHGPSRNAQPTPLMGHDGPSEMLALQRTAGNHAVARLMRIAGRAAPPEPEHQRRGPGWGRHRSPHRRGRGPDQRRDRSRPEHRRGHQSARHGHHRNDRHHRRDPVRAEGGGAPHGHLQRPGRERDRDVGAADHHQVEDPHRLRVRRYRVLPPGGQDLSSTRPSASAVLPWS